MSYLKLKKVLAILMATVMCFTLFPVSAIAEEITENLEDIAGDEPEVSEIQPASAEQPDEGGEIEADEAAADIEAEIPEVPADDADESELAEELQNPADEPQGPAKVPEETTSIVEAAPSEETATDDLNLEENTAGTPEEESEPAGIALEPETGHVEAKNSVTASGVCGSDLRWTLTDTGALSIVGTGAMDDYSAYGSQFYSRRTQIKSISVGEGVTSIGAYAFEMCSVASITLPSTLRSIGNSAFSYCSKLTAITIPSGVTEIKDKTFEGCSDLVKAVIPSSVTRIGEKAFSECRKLSNTAIPNNVTYIGESAFKKCALTEVTLPASLESCGYGAFGLCPSLASLQIAEGAKALGEYMFQECKLLQEVIIPSSVKEIAYGAFTGCEGLRNVTIMDGVTKIKTNAFYGCKSLTEITIPRSVSDVGDFAFEQCTSLTTVTFKPGIKTIGSSAFGYCSRLREIHFLGGPPYIESSSFTSVTAYAYYPNNGTWTAAKLKNYGGTLTWIAIESGPSFQDVQDPSAYYYEPVYWAVEHGITAGTSPTTFSPSNPCTRGQIVTFLWKAMGSPEPSSTSNPFTDVSDSDYFYKPVLWAKENGVTSGKTATTFEPYSTCTRGQIVTFLWKAMGSPEPSSMYNPFTDVSPSDYFFKPILWAKERGITSGTSATTFSPYNPCTRAQAMTFLYKAMH